MPHGTNSFNSRENWLQGSTRRYNLETPGWAGNLRGFSELSSINSLFHFDVLLCGRASLISSVMRGLGMAN